MATAAALGMALGPVAGPAAPAWAADALEIKVGDNNLQAKLGDKTNVGFQLRNNTKTAIGNIVVTLQTPANAVADPGDNPGCNVGAAGRIVTCSPNGTLGPDKTTAGRIVLTTKAAGQGSGRIGVKPGNSTDSFGLRVVGGPSPSVSASAKSPKPTRSASASVSDTPGIPDQTLAPPQAGNGAIPQATTDPATTKTSGGGLSLGFWVGIVAIVGALGLIGSLFYFRRRDRDEPDTGLQPAAAGPGGYGPPAAYGQPQYDQPQYDQPQWAQPQYGPPSYGPPPAGPTQVINPGGVPAQPTAPTQIIKPPDAGPATSSDQTVTFQRPEQY